MTQRIFDIENEKDMADLWDILPDEVCKIEASCGDVVLVYSNAFRFSIDDIFSINWHDKTEITRPIQEATEQDIGKLCYFWDNDGTRTYGLLSDLIIEESEDRKYGCVYGRRWIHARRLNKQEIEELC
jgi:hypothetical protein